MIKVLFVCLGNICRSPMGEAIFRHMVNKSGLEKEILVDSCGTMGYHTGEPPHDGTKKILEKNGISYNGIKASTLTYSHLTEFDYILAMDKENLKDILKLNRAEAKGSVRLLSEFAKGGWVSVPDPWYTGDFDLTYSLIEEGCNGLLDHLKEKI